MLFPSYAHHCQRTRRMVLAPEARDSRVCDAYITTDNGVFYIDEVDKDGSREVLHCFRVMTKPFSTDQSPINLPLPWGRVGVWR